MGVIGTFAAFLWIAIIWTGPKGLDIINRQQISTTTTMTLLSGVWRRRHSPNDTSPENSERVKYIWEILFICMARVWKNFIQLFNCIVFPLWSKSWYRSLSSSEQRRLFPLYLWSFFRGSSLWIAPDFWWESPEMSLGERFVFFYGLAQTILWLYSTCFTVCR